MDPGVCRMWGERKVNVGLVKPAVDAAEALCSDLQCLLSQGMASTNCLDPRDGAMLAPAAVVCLSSARNGVSEIATNKQWMPAKQAQWRNPSPAKGSTTFTKRRGRLFDESVPSAASD